MAEILKYDYIIYQEREKIALLTLNRPEKRNCLSLELLQELSACLKHVAQERSAKVVIVR